MIDRERALHLLLGRYRYEEAMRLFGEYCLLMEEDWNDFIARHSPVRLRQIHKQLLVVGLWPIDLAPPPSQGTGILKAVTGLLGNLRATPPEDAGIPERPPVDATPALVAETATGRDPEQVLQSLVAPPLSIELSPTLACHAAVGGEESGLHDAIALSRYRLAHDLGFVFPLVHVRENPDVTDGHYALRLNGETVAEGAVVPEMKAAIGPGLPAGIKTEAHPVRGVGLVWVTEPLAGFGGEYQAPHAIIAEHLEDLVRRQAHRLFNNQSLDMLLRTYEHEVGKDTLSELFGRFMSLTELRLVLQAMLKAGYGIRNLPRIIDLLMNHFINYLAEKPLSMDETWKISSHIPFFSTEELTRVVCEGLGLAQANERKAGVTAMLERAVRQAPATGSGSYLPGPVDGWEGPPAEPMLDRDGLA